MVTTEDTTAPVLESIDNSIDMIPKFPSDRPLPIPSISSSDDDPTNESSPNDPAARPLHPELPEELQAPCKDEETDIPAHDPNIGQGVAADDVDPDQLLKDLEAQDAKETKQRIDASRNKLVEDTTQRITTLSNQNSQKPLTGPKSIPELPKLSEMPLKVDPRRAQQPSNMPEPNNRISEQMMLRMESDNTSFPGDSTRPHGSIAKPINLNDALRISKVREHDNAEPVARTSGGAVVEVWHPSDTDGPTETEEERRYRLEALARAKIHALQTGRHRVGLDGPTASLTSKNADPTTEHVDKETLDHAVSTPTKPSKEPLAKLANPSMDVLNKAHEQKVGIVQAPVETVEKLPPHPSRHGVSAPSPTLRWKPSPVKANDPIIQGPRPLTAEELRALRLAERLRRESVMGERFTAPISNVETYDHGHTEDSDALRLKVEHPHFSIGESNVATGPIDESNQLDPNACEDTERSYMEGSADALVSPHEFVDSTTNLLPPPPPAPSSTQRFVHTHIEALPNVYNEDMPGESDPNPTEMHAELQELEHSSKNEMAIDLGQVTTDLMNEDTKSLTFTAIQSKPSDHMRNTIKPQHATMKGNPHTTLDTLRPSVRGKFSDMLSPAERAIEAKRHAEKLSQPLAKHVKSCDGPSSSHDDSSPGMLRHVFSSYRASKSGARCMDGSPAGFYHHIRNGTQKWVIHLEGGTPCDTEVECMDRLHTNQGSSLSWPESRNVDIGLVSNDPKRNPDFNNWNHIVIPHCSGDFFVGQRHDPIYFDGSETTSTSPPSPTAQPFYFSGHAILYDVIAKLLESGLGNATHVLLSGHSAGAIGILSHADEIAQSLPNANVRAYMEAGWWLDNANLTPMFDFENFYTQINPFLQKDCVAAYGHDLQWKCFYAPHALPFSFVPFFVANVKYDLVQSLHVAEDSLTSLSAEQCSSVSQFGKEMTASMANSFILPLFRHNDKLPAFHTIPEEEIDPFYPPTNLLALADGIFMPSCVGQSMDFAHSTAHFRSDIEAMGNYMNLHTPSADDPDTYTLTLSQLFGNWYFGREGPTRYVSNPSEDNTVNTSCNAQAQTLTSLGCV